MRIGCRLVGKVAADNSHKWVFREVTKESDPGFVSSWNTSMEPVREPGKFSVEWKDECVHDM